MLCHQQPPNRPGVLLGEVVFHRNSGNSPQAPPNVTARTHLDGDLVVSWDSIADAELTRIRSSVVEYEVQCVVILGSCPVLGR